ncbi:hypothetical protein BU23DRAFT_579529 [Bimuria novae-zelandiae CBS 107.79]|uniref:Pullulan synthetase n=1 Tax=Bimuria novae-zelandiae CBS 107.79 TaxID=1447943 RepID=A0A6A5VBC9_9PLEO|nr:hypothetical protein BU23DRAFT_579529 [Bimuria novae-zelandiae CBS 107.79]
MRFTILTVLSALSASLATALPTELTQFFLVTSDQSDPNANSSQLRGVHATTPYAEDPVSQSTLLLRLIGAGYNSLPNFTLTDGVLATTTSGPHGIGSVTYNSTAVVAGQELQFMAQQQEGGNVALDGGYLVTVDGETEGWTICDSARGMDVLWWRGEGSDCKSTFLHAVSKPPYRK